MKTYLDYLENFKLIEKNVLPFVEKPARYLGIELYKYLKNIDEKINIKFCLIFPDLYEIGISSLGIKLLFHYLNQYENILVDLAFMPKLDFINLMKENNFPLYSLGYKIPIKDFDLVGFSLGYELCYTNMLSILDNSKIALDREKRDENSPIILAGGCSTSNPFPIKKFIDVFSLGDGEEVLNKICKKFLEGKIKNFSRKEKISHISSLEGIFVPGFTKGIIKPKVVKDLETNFFPTDIITPIVSAVHEHLSIEIQRGCFRSCKFCHASFINRPVRIRSLEKIKSLVLETMDKKGVMDISLLSLSVIDYPYIKELLEWFVDNFYEKRYSISLPSLRCDKFSLELAKLVNKNKKASLTFAPEAGSQRLRDYIGKNVTEDDILEAVSMAYNNGWKLIKLYFMYGLPTEEFEDIKAIIDLIWKIKYKFRGIKLNIGISSFVPKSHTPFAWERQEKISSLMEKKKFIIDECRKTKIASVKHSKLEGSIVEGLFARGSSEIGLVLEEAYKNGALFDQWEEHFNYDIWKKAGEKFNINIEDYVTRCIDFNKKMDWENINYGIDRNTLYRMSKKIYVVRKKSVSKNNENNEIFENNIDNQGNQKILKRETENCKKINNKKIKLRAIYEKSYKFRFISHLELIDIIRSSLMKSGLKIAFSNGFHPLPNISFGPPLSVGHIGLNEMFDIEIYDENLNIDEILKDINKSLPTGIFLKKIIKLGTNFIPLSKLLNIFDYTVINDIPWNIEFLDKFLESRIFYKEIEKKGKKETFDLKLFVKKIEIKNFDLNLIVDNSKSYINLFNILKGIFNIDDISYKKMIIKRNGFIF